MDKHPMLNFIQGEDRKYLSKNEAIEQNEIPIFLIGRHPKSSPSIGRCRGEWRRGQSNVAIRSIKHRIEPLKERVAVDEVEARSRGRAEVVDDQVDTA